MHGTPQLSDYEAAFERVEQRLLLDRDHDRAEALIRRRLHAPTWRFWGVVALIAALAASSLVGVRHGWMVALGLAMADLPLRWERVQRRQRALAAVDSADDVRRIVHDEARRRMAGAFVGSLLLGGLGVLYVLVGLVALWLDRSPWPGVLSGLILFAWSAVQLLVRMPRAAREARLLEEEASE